MAVTTKPKRRVVSARERRKMPKALHPTRVGIVGLMRDGQPWSSKLLAERLADTLGAVAYHVRLLYTAGIVTVHSTERRRGAIETFYVLDRDAVAGIPEVLADVAGEAAQLLELFATRARTADAQAIAAAELAERLRKAGARDLPGQT